MSIAKADTSPPAGSPAGLSASMRSAMYVWGALALLELIVMFPTASSMATKWWTDGTFGHALFILPLVGWLIWQRREEIKATKFRPSWLGIVATGLASLLWFTGWLADVTILQQAGLVFMLQASILAVFGWAMVKVILFPLFYLVFAIPFGSELIPPLQDFTAEFVVKGLQLSGIPVHLDGFFISIPAGDFEVAETCSGIRFLIASVSFGSLFANVSFSTWQRRLGVMVLAVVVPIIANGFRAYGIVMIAHLSNMKYAVGADHIIFGWVFFSIVLLILIAIGTTFSDRAWDKVGESESAREMPTAAGSPGQARTIPAVALAAMLVGPGLAAAIASNVPTEGSMVLGTIESPRGWRRTEQTPLLWRPQYVGADSEMIVHFNQGAWWLSVYSGYYAYQKPGKELVQYSNHVADLERWGLAGRRTRRVEIEGQEFDVTESRLTIGGFTRTVWHLYWIDGGLTANPYIAKLYSARQKLRAGGEGALVLVFSAMGGDATANGEMIRSFIAQLGGLDAVLKTILSDGEAVGG